MNRKKIIWAEKLGIIELITLYSQNIFSDNLVCYDEHQISFWVRWVLNVLKRLNLLRHISPAELTLNEKDSKGYAINYRREKILDFCGEEFCKLYIPDNPDWFKKMTKSYIAKLLFYQATFITMVESKIRDTENQKHVLYLVRHPLNSLLFSFYKKKDLTIKESFSLSEALKFYCYPFFLILIIFASKLLPKRIRTNISEVKPAIWVEYTHNDLVDFTFWRNSVKAEDYDIVYYLDRNDTPCTQEIVNEIKKKGLKWIDAHRYSLFRMSNLHLSKLLEIVGELLSVSPFLPIWFKIFQFENRVWYFVYQSVFNYYQVKILIQHQEFSWKQGVQARAIESVGGIMLGFQWSNFQFNIEPIHLTPQHVYFVWGEAKHDWVQKKGNTCRYILPSGLLIISNNNDEAMKCSFSEEVNFIISIFDSSASYNLFQSPDTLSQFYLALLKLLENNSTWGGIVKSKNYTKVSDLDSLPQGKKITSRMESLIQQGRLIFLSKLVYPDVVAGCANLSVCYGLNTAGIIAGIYGYKAIHWDCCGWLEHPFYKEKGQKIMYSALNDFEEAILKAAEGDKSIGYFTYWQKDYNFFNDFSAAERVGAFIEDFMGEIIKTKDLEYSLNQTVYRYMRNNKISNDLLVEKGILV